MIYILNMNPLEIIHLTKEDIDAASDNGIDIISVVYVNMSFLFLIICLFFAHWVGDFVFQDDNTAKSKSNNKWVLIKHCLSYSGVMWIYLLALIGFKSTTYVPIFFFSHFIIDGITSQITKYYYQKENRHMFFVTIGFDQFLHSFIILLVWHLTQGGLK